MILITFYDLFKSVVLPRPAINKFVLIRRAFFTLWNFWLWANERQAPSRREGWLATFGPIAVLFMFATWGMILMIGYAFIIAMTATSFDRTATAIGARAWRRLHLAGGYYLLFQFMVSFGKRIPDMPLYALFLIPLVAVFALRMASMAAKAAPRPAQAG